MSWDCGLKYMFSVSPALQQGNKCILHDKEELSRLEMVQKLAKDGCRFLQNHGKSPERTSEPQSDEAVRLCVRERGHDVLVFQRVSSELAASVRGGGRDEAKNRRYVVVSGTPEKILEHLLNGLTLEDDRGTTQGKESETLLDDFLLTYPVFMSTGDLCQALLGHYCTKRLRGKEALGRKQKVLRLVSQWTSLCKDFLQEDENVNVFLKALYQCVYEDLYEHPVLEKEVQELQKLYQLHHRHAADNDSPHRNSKTLFHQLSLKENRLRSRSPQRETRQGNE